MSTLRPNIQVSKYPLQWQVTYEAVDEAGNYAEPKVRTIEIQASGEGRGRSRWRACSRGFGEAWCCAIYAMIVLNRNFARISGFRDLFFDLFVLMIL